MPLSYTGEWMFGLTFKPGTRWRWVVGFTPRPLHPRGVKWPGVGPGAGLESLRPAAHSMSHTGCRERGNPPHIRITIVTAQLLGAVGIKLT
jgi:hypothetical protein